MQIEVKLFGPQAVLVGSDAVKLASDTDAPTCAWVLTHLGEAAPELAASLPQSRVAVNHAFATPETVVREGDEVALIGMVSGG